MHAVMACFLQVFAIILQRVAIHKTTIAMNKTAFLSTVKAFEDAFLENRSFPGSEEDFLSIIHHYHSQNYQAQALEAVDEAIRQHPTDLQWYLIKAQILIELQQASLAVRTLSDTASINPDATAVKLLKIEALICMGMYDEATTILDALKWECETEIPADIWVAESKIHESRQEYERMFFALQTALNTEPCHVQALERMGSCIDYCRRYKESILIHETILDTRPFCHLAWYNLGHAQAHLGLYEEAIQSLEYAFLTQSDFEAAYLECGELCLETGNPGKALQCFWEALERFGTNGELLFLAGRACFEMGDYPRASTYFSKAWEHEPYDDEILFFTGRCYAAQGHWKKAIRSFAKAIDIEDQREEYHIAMADALAAIGKMAEAGEYYAEALLLAPDSETCILAYARFLYRQHEYEQAKELLENAGAWGEAPAGLTYAHIACVHACGKTAEALYLLAEVLEIYPEGASMLQEWAPALWDLHLIRTKAGSPSSC